jgi:hypothetical protein
VEKQKHPAAGLIPDSCPLVRSHRSSVSYSIPSVLFLFIGSPVVRR